MFAKPNDTSKALILSPKSVHGLSRWILRLDGGFWPLPEALPSSPTQRVISSASAQWPRCSARPIP